MINVRIFGRMGADDDCNVGEGLGKPRNHSLKISKDGQLQILKAQRVFACHAFGRPSEKRRLSVLDGRLKQVLDRRKPIDVVEIGIDQNEIAVALADACDFLFIIGIQFGAQQVVAWVAGDNDGRIWGYLGIAAPQGGIISIGSSLAVCR